MRRRSHRAFTIIELMVVIAIMALLSGAALYGVGAIVRTDLRGSASKLAGAIRYCFDRSITTGSYYRLVLDLDNNKYWAEKSDDRMYLTRDKEDAPGDGKAFDYDAAEKKKDEEEKKEKEKYTAGNTLAASLDPPPKPRRAKFQTFKDATLPQVTLHKVKFFDLYTPRQKEPYRTGKAYLYFFPDGHTERAVLRLTDGDDFYSLIVHGLTGRVEVMNGKYDIPRDFDDKLDETK